MPSSQKISPLRPRLRKKPINPPFIEPSTLSFKETSTQLAAHEKLLFKQSGVQEKRLKKLQKGQLPIDSEVDLHGLYQDKALITLSTYMDNEFNQGHRVLCIIHGKGLSTKESDYPVLKNLVNQFLMNHDKVLAFTSAPTHQGGAGATLVLLKNLSKETLC